MIISHKHKFIFIHNPKCAGQSVREVLRDYHDSEVLYWDHEYNAVLDRIVDRAHLWAKDFSLYEPLDLGDFFVFGYVRNPYDRFKSAYNQYWLMNPDHELMDVNSFAEKYINDLSIRYDWNLIHFCPQYLFFYDGRKRIADFIGKQEKYAEDLIFISSVLGFHIEHQVINKSRSDNIRKQDYSAKTLRLINELYERDFILFDYPMIIPDDHSVDEQLQTYRARINRAIPNIANTVLALEDENKHLQEENSKTIERLNNVESELQGAQSELQCSRSGLQDARSELQDARSELQDARSELQDAQISLQDVETTLNKLYASRSWRYAKPLRKIVSVFRK